MDDVYAKLEKTFSQVRSMTDFVPLIGLVLGSGLGEFASCMKVIKEIPYEEIEGFPVSTVPGHSGRFIFGYFDQVPVICMKGRVHYYEGYEISDVVLPIRLMRKLGAEILFLTNAAGGVNETFSAGDLMMITDQISVFAPNPLIGPNLEELGTRFPDMSQIYDQELRKLIRETAEKYGIPLREGIYTQLTGPSYESPAEIRMLRTLGTDAVGMSTAVEAIAGRHAGMRVCGISCISNLAAGMSGKALNHIEVQEAGKQAAEKFTKLVSESLREIFEVWNQVTGGDG